MALDGDVQGPRLPTLVDLKNRLRGEPLYLQVLEDYLHNAANLINGLTEELRRMRNDGAVELPVHGASPSPSSNHQPVPALVDSWEHEEVAEWQEVSQPIPTAPENVPERMEVEGVREIELRSRTIYVPTTTYEEHAAIAAGPEPFQAPVLEGLPAQYQQMLRMPSNDPYTVRRIGDDGSATIECGMCGKVFGTLKGWRIHATKMHQLNGFCQKCGRFVNMPRNSPVEEVAARMEIHRLEWCPKATKAVFNERAIKRRRLELVGRTEEAQQFYVPDRYSELTQSPSTPHTEEESIYSSIQEPSSSGLSQSLYFTPPLPDQSSESHADEPMSLTSRLFNFFLPNRFRR